MNSGKMPILVFLLILPRMTFADAYGVPEGQTESFRHSVRYSLFRLGGGTWFDVSEPIELGIESGIVRVRRFVRSFLPNPRRRHCRGLWRSRFSRWVLRLGGVS